MAIGGPHGQAIFAFWKFYFFLFLARRFEHIEYILPYLLKLVRRKKQEDRETESRVDL